MENKDGIITEGKERRWLCTSHPDARKKLPRVKPELEGIWN